MITTTIFLLNLGDSLLTNPQIDEPTTAMAEPKFDLNQNSPNLVQREKIFGVKSWNLGGMSNNNKIPEIPLCNWNLQKL